jgi:hypothetical protein
MENWQAAHACRKRRLEFLNQWLAQFPDDTEAMYYLGACYGDLAQSAQQLGEPAAEVNRCWQSSLEVLGRLAHRANPDPSDIQAYLDTLLDAATSLREIGDPVQATSLLAAAREELETAEAARDRATPRDWLATQRQELQQLEIPTAEATVPRRQD